ncbi:MAG TPA: TlpA disulfide reductase family protein [Acidobacteriaceae bacterium]
MKRNLVVILVIVVALGLMTWSGYQNLQRRRAAQKAQPHVTVLDQSNQTVQQDVASDEGLPNLRGKKAPVFTLKTEDGRKVSLADYKGKAVLLNFWATWCVPCKLEMPWFVDLHKQYAAQGFEILGVNEDEAKDRPQISKFANKIGVNYPILIGNDAAVKAYGGDDGIDVLPISFYIGRDGKVVEEAVGLISRDEIEANIKKALAAGN